MPGADPSWRRVMVSARTDWQRKQHACREALVESRLRHRRDLLRFVSQGGGAARPTSEPSAQVVCDHAIAGPGDVRRCSLVCREWAVAARVWLRSPLAKTFWRGVCLELCPESVLAHPELGDRETVLRWLRLPMAVGTLKAWLAQERHGCASAEGVCATRYELAHGLATLFAFLANAGEGRSRQGAFRAPRFIGWRGMRFAPFLVGAAHEDARLAGRLCASLQDFAIWLGLRDDTEAGRVVAECAERTFVKLAKFLDLEPPRRDLAAPGDDTDWGVETWQAARLATFLRDHAPLFPQRSDVAPRAGDTRLLVPCPWNDLLVRDGVDVDGRDGWRFSRARKANAGAAWAAAWESPPPLPL